MARNSTKLRKKLSVSEYYKLSRRIAKDYESSPASIARTVLMERHDVTESGFYTLLEFAVTHHLVSDKIVDGIREKMLSNQAAHGNNGYTTNLKYNRLEAQRRNYSAFSKKDIVHITTFYAEHPEYTKEQTAKVFGFYSKLVLDKLFRKACLELIISDKIFEKLKERSIATAKDAQITTQFFALLEQRRTESKKAFKQKNTSAF